MTEAKFTKGPWWTDGEYSADECGVSVIAVMEDCGYLPGNPTRGMVAFVSELLPENADRAKANAHLIAAAPELYEALAETERYFSDEDGLDEDEYYYRHRVRSALAKARGETP